MTELYLPAGAAASGSYDLEITPTSAGWGYSSLRVTTLDAGAEHRFSCEGEEIIVVPLSGSATSLTAPHKAYRPPAVEVTVAVDPAGR